MNEKERSVKNSAAMILLLAEHLPNAYAANFATEGVSWKKANVMGIIFARQMLAIARYDSSEFSLGRALALILVGGIIDSPLSDNVTAVIVDDIFNSNEWGRQLVDEYLAGDTPAACFAESCAKIELGWGDPEKEGEPSAPADFSVAQRDFLANVSKLIVEPRSGWLKWKVSGVPLETIADHIVASQLTAISMKFTYKYPDPSSEQDGVDIERAISHIALHDLPVAEIGDAPVGKTQSGNSWEAKLAAFKAMVDGLPSQCVLEALFVEYSKRKSITPQFACSSGKISTDFRAKAYGEEGRVNLAEQDDNDALENEKIKVLLDSGCSWPEMWIRYSQLTFGYDQNFMGVTDYLVQNPFWDK